MGKEVQACPLGFNKWTNGFSGMGRQVVHHQDVTSVQSWEQLRAHIDFKGRAFHGAFKAPGSRDFLPAQCSNQSGMRTRIARRRFYNPLAGGSSTAQTRQAQMCPTFIEKFQAVHKFTQRVHKLRLKVLSQSFYPRRLALAVVERLLFAASSISSGVMLSLACMPFASWTRSHNSASEISGCFWTSARMRLSAARSFRFGPGLPGKASQLPVSRQWYHHFSKVDLWIPNCAAASACVLPASKAAITRSRKSWGIRFHAQKSNCFFSYFFNTEFALKSLLLTTNTNISNLMQSI
jgi:hypothetical protein